MDEYDIIIIGSGLGGLACATILSKEGLRVLVLEKNNQYGGNLQTFARDKCVFDTGVHYIGGLLPEQNLHRYFSYLGIAEKLQIQRMDIDAFDVISFDDDPVSYPHAQGYENFIARLTHLFPSEEDGIRKYVALMQRACASFPLYHLQAGRQQDEAADFAEKTVYDSIQECTQNKRLQAVLAGSNLLYAGDKEKTPFYVHALSVNSYIESAWRCIKGGSQIAKLLVREIKKHEGKVLKRHKVTHFTIENNLIQHVHTANGKVFKAKTVISNADPKTTLRLLGNYPLRKNYVNRIVNTKDTIASFSVYIVFKKQAVPYANHNHYHFTSADQVWESIHYNTTDWPTGFMASMNPDTTTPQWAESMSVLTYMRYEEVLPWAHSTNTVAQLNERGEDYEQFKIRKTEAVLAALERKFPDIRRHIKTTYAATPLTYRDYIGNPTGSMYGFVKDVHKPLHNYLPPRSKISNLLFTGQGIGMHGILGVSISAIITCGALLGLPHLLEKIQKTTND